MITFELTKEQSLIQKTAKEFAAGEMRQIARDCDENDDIPPKVLNKAWEMGLANAAVPEAFGGIGMARSAMASALICEELGYGCASLATAIMAPSTFIHPLIDFGTEDQKQRYLPAYSGEKFAAAAAALHEPHFTFDVTDMRTVAQKSGDHWVLNGVKRLVPFAQKANHFLVLAKMGDQTGLAHVGAFIISKDAKGLTVDQEFEKTMGLKPLPKSKLTLTNVNVPDKDRLGESNSIDGRRLINTLRVANSAICVGLAKAVLDTSVPYSKQRVAFDAPIATRQAIAFMLSEMHSETEAMRWLVWKAASQLDQNSDATKAAALAQHYANKNTVIIADRGVQIFGGHGYIRDLPLEMWLRNARTLTVMEGVVAA
ncbi:MAG: acyl-CoA dehydrogenase family protein [Desulfobacteraceae bacterium]|nr:acyl-CoA dehydrogenase family protein [Desulfobacteraceae bacterium]